MTLYVGNNDAVTQKVKKAYIGVDGIGRNIKAMYVGDDDGIARKVFPDAQGGGKKGILFSSPNPFTLYLESVINNPTPRDWVNMEYSFDENTWTPIELVQPTGQKIHTVFPESVLNPTTNNYEIYVRSDRSMNEGEFIASNGDTVHFDSIGGESDNISVSGEIANLWGANSNSNSSFNPGCANSLFYSFEGLIDASELILPEVEIIPSYGYNRTFYICSNLQKPPKQIYGNIIEDYGCNGMFSRSGIIHSPIFTPTTVKKCGCCAMFDSCYKLIDTPDFGLVTTLIGESNFESCFEDCQSLHEPNFNQLKPTTLTKKCYSNMLIWCPLTKLITLPPLSYAEPDSCNDMMTDILLARTQSVTDLVFEIQYSGGRVCGSTDSPIPLIDGEEDEFETNTKYYFDNVISHRCRTSMWELQFDDDEEYVLSNGFISASPEWDWCFSFATQEWFEQRLAGTMAIDEEVTGTVTDEMYMDNYDYDMMYDHIENGNTVVFVDSYGGYMKLRNDNKCDIKVKCYI